MGSLQRSDMLSKVSRTVWIDRIGVFVIFACENREEAERLYTYVRTVRYEVYRTALRPRDAMLALCTLLHAAVSTYSTVRYCTVQYRSKRDLN